MQRIDKKEITYMKQQDLNDKLFTKLARQKIEYGGKFTVPFGEHNNSVNHI